MEEKDSNVSTRRNTKKILNNSYRNGDNLKSGEEYEFSRSLSVDTIDAEQFMNVSYDMDSIMYQEMVDCVNDYIDSSEELKSILMSDLYSPESEEAMSKKYTKDEINDVFFSIHEVLNAKYSRFFKISYAFQIISNILSLTHISLFDNLDYENKKLVLIGLSNELGIDITKSKNFVY